MLPCISCVAALYLDSRASYPTQVEFVPEVSVFRSRSRTAGTEEERGGQVANVMLLARDVKGRLVARGNVTKVLDLS